MDATTGYAIVFIQSVSTGTCRSTVYVLTRYRTVFRTAGNLAVQISTGEP
jgi:hypothetical protein